jgi:hypothetical protein
MPVAGTRYGYLKAPWDAPLSLGVQSLIEYNGYLINDRYQSDRVFVTGITGLDGPDVTDVREVVPGDDGEFAYQSPYRGRTFVITGLIQCGSLAMSTAMGRDLRAAYAPLVESPMKFRWFDVYENFDDPTTLQNYTAIGTLANLSVSNGVLSMTAAAPVILMRTADKRMYCDVQITTGFYLGTAGDATTLGTILSFVNSTNYMVARFNGGADLVEIVTVVNGAENVVASTAITTYSQGLWYLRGRKEGDMVTAEIWTAPPTDFGTPAYITQGWLTGSDADTFGDGTISNVGLELKPATANTWALDDLTIDSLYPGDISFMAKTISKPSIADAQQKQTRFERAFQLTLRTSWPYAQGAHQRRSTVLVPSTGNTTSLGFTNPLTNPLSAISIIPSTVTPENNLLFINNRGTAPERPVLYIYGATGQFTIINLQNGMQLSWDNVLNDGSYLIFDCKNRTLVDQTGANQKGAISYSDPRWMILEPGWNDLYFVSSTTTAYSANTKMVAYMRDRYI